MLHDFLMISILDPCDTAMIHGWGSSAMIDWRSAHFVDRLLCCGTLSRFTAERLVCFFSAASGDMRMGRVIASEAWRSVSCNFHWVWIASSLAMTNVIHSHCVLSSTVLIIGNSFEKLVSCSHHRQIKHIHTIQS